MKASLPTFHCSLPVSRRVVISPRKGGAKSNSPGPVYVDVAISPPAINFFIENLTAPLSVMVGDMAIMIPAMFPSMDSFQIDGIRPTRLRRQWAAHSELKCNDRITIPMTNPITPSVECPNIILCRHCTSEMARSWRPARHLRRLVRIQWLFWRQCWLRVNSLCPNMASIRRRLRKLVCSRPFFRCLFLWIISLRSSCLNGRLRWRGE